MSLDNVIIYIFCMLQKVLLIVLIALTGFSVFMINKIYKKIEAKPEAPVYTASSKIDTPKEMPKIWEDIPNLENTKVYLSYDSPNSEFATEIYNKLTLDGFVVFMPQVTRNELKNDEEALKALINADIFIMIYSDEYKNNYIANQEFGAALIGKKKIIGLITERIPDVIKYTENIIFFEKGADEKTLMEDIKKFL